MSAVSALLAAAAPLSASAEAEPARGAAFLVLLAFLVSFLLVRTNTRLIRSPKVPWWPGDLETEGGLHIHHLVWGISLLLLSGFLAFASDLEEPWWQITAAGFGIGAGLTLDEFALWLRLEDVYWSDQGRASIDAVIVAALFAGLVVVGVQPFGLDEPASVLGTIAVVGGSVGVASITFLKGRLALGVLAVFIPLVGLVFALRLAKPSSPWSRWFYAKRRPERLERARHRFASDRRAAVLGRRIQELIGGAPSR
ncbi:MAG: hypothetical protein M3502_05155 [Actinomycetota bacterium]|nr:hypothetical protein [Actinomycetota bacterium]